MHDAPSPSPRLLAICAGPAQRIAGRVQQRDTEVLSGIRKQALSSLESPVEVAFDRLGIAGDEQADPSVHGGIDKAVYLYPVEHYPDWARRAARAGVGFAGAAGSMGENLLVSGLTEDRVWIGDRLLIGTVELMVTQPRRPCFKFDLHLGYDGAGREMVRAVQPGWYCEVVRPGTAAAGQPILQRAGSRSDTIEATHRRMHRLRSSVPRTGVN